MRIHRLKVKEILQRSAISTTLTGVSTTSLLVAGVSKRFARGVLSAMSYRRTATVLRPWMVGGTLNGALGATRTPYAQRPLAIIIAQLRTVSTEPAAHTAGSTYPPPGFDPSKAKKALPQDQKASAGQNEKSSSSKPVTLDSEVADSVAISKSKPTSHAKTAAQEAVSLAEQVPANPGAGKGEDKKLSSGQGEPQKLTLMEKIKRELVHYWDGTKLLAVEIKISSKLALKMAAGYELTRREERQVQGPTLLFLKADLLTLATAPTYCQRSCSPCAVLCLSYCAFRRTTAASCP